MKKITLFGEELTFAFSLAVQIFYEKATDTAFDLRDLTKAECRAALYFAIIAVNNPETKITLDMLIREVSFDDIKMIDEATNEVVSAWYHIPTPANFDEEPAPEEPEDEETSKNA